MVRMTQKEVIVLICLNDLLMRFSLKKKLKTAAGHLAEAHTLVLQSNPQLHRRFSGSDRPGGKVFANKFKK